MITCVSGITIRMAVSNISELGRATQGVKLIRVDDGDEIAAITQLDEKDEDEELLDEAGNPITASEEGIAEQDDSVVETPAAENDADVADKKSVDEKDAGDAGDEKETE
jgi:DNA gyrase subunit A